MLKRLLKLMSGLIPFWGKRNDLLNRVGKALAPDCIDEPFPDESDYSSTLDFMIDRHDWEWRGSPTVRGARAELKRLRYFKTIGEMVHWEDASYALDQIIDRHIWNADTLKAKEELRLLKEDSFPGRADYRACDTCNAFLTARESSDSTCRRCAAARRAKYCHGPFKAEACTGGVDISFPAPFPTATPFGTERPRITVRLGCGQAMACAKTLVEPGSDGMGIGFDGNDSMLIVSWRDGDIKLVVCRLGLGDKTLILSAAQAARLGKDIGGCLGIEFTGAPVCDHEFTDGRNAVVASGVCMKCGQDAIGTPRAFLEYIRKSNFDRNKLHTWEREALASYLRIPRASSDRPANATACDHEFADARNAVVASGEVCMKCGTIRAGNRDIPRRAQGDL